jgi:hypothetical protein
MPTSRRRLTAATLVLAAAAGCVIALGPCLVRAQPTDGAWEKFTYQDSVQCKRCHTAPTADYKEAKSLEFVLLTEYAIWKTHDKHAQAYAVLDGVRGKRMGRLLGFDVEKDATWKERAGCLGCHAMDDLSKENVAKGAGKGLDPLDGVSCGGCHGPSSYWNGEHVKPEWRQKTPRQKFQAGMRDLRDPAVRGRLCMSCHVGDAAAGRVATHAMFAAGHPPLPPIELATFSRNEPKHWRDARDVPAFRHPQELKIDLKNYHAEDLAFQQTRLAVVGTFGATAENLRLAADRTGLVAGVPRRGWPELAPAAKDMTAAPDEKFRAAIRADWAEVALAHSDCYACHHDLRYPGFRQERGFGYQLPGRGLVAVRPGRVLVRSWPLAGLEAGLALTADSGARLDQLQERLRALAAATNTRALGDPATIQGAASPLVLWCEEAQRAVAAEGAYTADSALRLLHTLCRLYAPRGQEGRRKPAPIPDYESARQVASLLRVVYDDWAAKQGVKPDEQKAARDLLAELTEQFDLEPYSQRAKRTEVVLGVIKDIVGRLSPDQEKGLEAFANYLKPANIGKPAELDKMIGNPFLAKLDTGVGNQGFTKGLLKPAVADELQKLSDEEEKVVLRCLADFAPRTFLERLNKLDRLLPQSKPAAPAGGE